jgi:hypothetical protein
MRETGLAETLLVSLAVELDTADVVRAFPLSRSFDASMAELIV